MAMTYLRTPGAANIKGPMYEAKMAALLFVRGINSDLDFQLASNVADAGALDDIIFRFKHADNDAWTTVFVQLKHKMKPTWLNQVILTAENNELGLVKYFKSYTKIKECMSCKDPSLFSGSIDDCIFILFTNAKANTELGGRSFAEGKAEEFVWSGTGTVIQFNPDGDSKLNAAMAAAFLPFGDDEKNYLKQVRVFADQPKESDMDKVIKSELGKSKRVLNDKNVNIDLLYRFFIDNVTEWCEKSNKILLKESDLFSKAWKKMKVSAEGHKARDDFLLSVRFVETAIERMRTHMMNGEADNSVFVVNSSEITSRLTCTKLIQAIGTSNLFIGVDALMGNLLPVISECQKEKTKWLVVSTQDYDSKGGDKFFSNLNEMKCAFATTKTRLAIVLCNNSLLKTLVSEFEELVIHDDLFEFSQLEENSKDLVLSKKISFQGKVTTLSDLFTDHLESFDQYINACSIVEILVSDCELIVGPKLALEISYYVPRSLHRAAVVNDTIFSVSTLAESIIVFYSSPRDLQSILMKSDPTVLPSIFKAALDPFPDALPVYGADGDTESVGKTWKIGALECNFSYFRSGKDVNVPVMRFRPQNNDLNLSSEWFVMVRDGSAEVDTNRVCSFYDAKHFLRYRDGKIVWVKSSGQINCIRQHIAENQLIPLDILDFKLNIGERLVLLCAEPGMGKTTLTVHLARQIKDKFPLKFVIRISLSESDISTLFDTGKHCDAFGFLSVAANIESETEKTLLKLALNETGNVVVLVDGFDEISPKYLEECLTLLSNLQQTKAEKLFLTSRNSVKIRLEDHSSTLAANLQKLNDKDKRLFLKLFWKDKSNLLGEENMDKFIDQLLEKMSQAISDRETDILGIPLQLEITATVLESHITESAGTSNLPNKLNLLYLMEKFVENKIRIYVEKKFNILKSDKNYDTHLETYTETCENNHTRAALLLIVSEEDIEELLSESKIKKTEKFLEDIGSCKDKTGIIDCVVNKKPRFVHRVFAEYFVAVWFAKHFKKMSRPFLEERLYKAEYSVVREIFDRLLARDNELHTLVLNKNLDGVRTYLQTGDVNAKDLGGRTALHLASSFTPKKDMIESARRTQILDLLIERTTDFNQMDKVHKVPPIKYADLTQSWIALDRLLPLSISADKYLTTTEANVSDKVLLSFMCTHNLDKLGQFCKDKGLKIDLTDRYTTDLRSILLKFDSRNVINVLSELTPSVGYPLHDASFKNNLAEVKRLIQVELDSSPENKLIFINQRDSKGVTALHYAAGFGKAMVMKFLLSNGADPMILDHSFGATPLHAAMVLGQIDAVSEVLNALPESERYDYITKGNTKHNFNAFHMAVGLGHVRAVRFLLDTVNSIGGVASKVALIRSRTGLKRTAFGLAAECKHIDIFNILLEDLKKGELTALINTQDDDGNITLHYAAFGGDVTMIGRVLELGGKIDMINNKHQTPAMMAAEAGHQAAVDLLNEKLETFEMD